MRQDRSRQCDGPSSARSRSPGPAAVSERRRLCTERTQSVHHASQNRSWSTIGRRARSIRPTIIRRLQGQDMDLIVHYPGDLPTADDFGRRHAADLGVDVGVVGAKRCISVEVDLFIGELGIGSLTGGRVTDAGDRRLPGGRPARQVRRRATGSCRHPGWRQRATVPVLRPESGTNRGGMSR